MNARHILLAFLTASLSFILYVLIAHQAADKLTTYRHSFLLVALLALIAQLATAGEEKARNINTDIKSTNKNESSFFKKNFLTKNTTQSSILTVIVLFSCFMYFGK
ncbi:hypothetical protein [Desulfovibrio psychrotolerans]|uniref:Uncharacterized protein n=1 Tax=Desulfovibrio psychrotolerans TaxID=415242 RepID=A0A7J0BXI9_9BACT|nr:hypothetical protein [Desulfovibrio psychrotolerans]GFM37881.1 hypothetical protein DSM19430T_25650 [Desulfovibrio psychrotolerans]